MGKASRSKGVRGSTEAKNLLLSRDWTVNTLTSGIACGDLIAIEPSGVTWLAEVKNTAAITTAHRKQAQTQAAKSKLPWLLMNKISGTSSWLVQRQGERPVVWHKGEA